MSPLPTDPDVTQPPVTLTSPEDGLSASGVVGIVPPGYEVLGELGRGGMGVVYKARQRALDRVVALKMILAGGHAGQEAQARFRTEAEAIARLVHPGIVQVYEIGECGGLPWFSLEFCDGGNLEKHLAGTPQPPAESAALVEQVARAVQAAHDKGVIHRDLKPANVLLASSVRARGVSEGLLQPVAHAPGSDFARPKITDFGLAKKLDAQSQTQTGSIMGTPSYMAPEQASGSKDIGPAADVWSLGAILYECLTGRPPFRAATSMDTILQVLSDDPVPPSRLVAKLPPDLETIALKCLQKTPRSRYSSAAALADDLAAFREGRPIAARPVGRIERGWRWAKRNRALAAAGLVTLFVLLAATLVSTIFAFQARQHAEIAKDALGDAIVAKRGEEHQRRAAENLLDTNRRQLVDLMQWRGQQILEAGEPVASLPWFAEAKRLDPEPADHRQRLARTLRDLPRPLHLWRLGSGVTHLALSPDGRRLAAADNAGAVRVWDVETGEAVGPALSHPPSALALIVRPDLPSGAPNGDRRWPRLLPGAMATGLAFVSFIAAPGRTRGRRFSQKRKASRGQAGLASNNSRPRTFARRTTTLLP